MSLPNVVLHTWRISTVYSRSPLNRIFNRCFSRMHILYGVRSSTFLKFKRNHNLMYTLNTCCETCTSFLFLSLQWKTIFVIVFEITVLKSSLYLAFEIHTLKVVLNLNAMYFAQHCMLMVYYEIHNCTILLCTQTHWRTS